MTTRPMIFRYRKLASGGYSLYKRGRKIGTYLYLSDCDAVASGWASGKPFVVRPIR